MILAVMGVQLVLILWLSRAKPVLPREVAAAPQVFLATGASDLSGGLSDPALYVLANPHGFSGKAWLQVPPLEYDLPKWSDVQFHPYQLPVAQLATEAGDFLRTNRSGTSELDPKPQPIFDISTPPFPLGNPQSTLTIEGELTGRPLLSAFKLNAWPDNEILTNSEVGVLVDVHGNVFSAVLLASCGAITDNNALKADAAALSLATAARFQPLPPAAPVGAPRAPAHLQWGKLVFHWQTVPLTNAIPVIP